MRAMITNPNLQQLLPAGNTNSLLLTAPGRELASLAEMIRKVDAVSAPPQARDAGVQGGAR